MSLDSYACACTVRAGKLRLFNVEAFNKALYQFPDGLDLELILQEPKRQRTSAQNRFFHGPICKAFMPLGYRTVQEAKDMLALLFIPYDITMLDGTIVRVPGSTSNLSVKDFNAFIEQCIQLAAENDIHIVDADVWRREHPAAA